MSDEPVPSQASELLARRVSLFRKVNATTPAAEISVADFLAGVKEGRWVKQVGEIRSAFADSGKAEADKLKRAKLVRGRSKPAR
jgi:hypothetical protein